MGTTAAPTRLSLPDQSLHVEFLWHDDRFGHQFVLADGLRIPSIEGDASLDWPPSPPLQQISREEIGDGYAIMGVGAAGKSHWSLSVDIADHDDTPCLRFDVACRAKVQPEWLGSRYQQSPLLAIEPISGSLVKAESDTTAIEPSSLASGETVRWGYLVFLP